MNDETRRFAAGICFIAALVIGLFFWSRSQPASTPPLPATTAEPAPTQAPQAIATPRIGAPAIASKPLPSAAPRVSPAAVAAAPAQPDAPPQPSTRIPFPSDLPRAFTASGFHDELARVIAECKFPYEVSEEDCTEFPCIAWGKWSSNMISPDDCPAFHDTFGMKTFIFAHNDVDGHPLVGLSIFPPSVPFSGDAMKHLEGRANGMQQAQEQRHIEITNTGAAQLHKAAPRKLTGQELAHK